MVRVLSPISTRPRTPPGVGTPLRASGDQHHPHQDGTGDVSEIETPPAKKQYIADGREGNEQAWKEHSRSAQLETNQSPYREQEQASLEGVYKKTGSGGQAA